MAEFVFVSPEVLREIRGLGGERVQEREVENRNQEKKNFKRWTKNIYKVRKQPVATKWTWRFR